VGSETTKARPRLAFSTSPGPTAPGRPQTFLRFLSVRARTGLSRCTIWRLERLGSFRRHRLISRNAVAWLEMEIADCMRSKADVGLGEPEHGRV
jgi:predicted DNA-binding transcriptional regulator AlpA